MVLDLRIYLDFMVHPKTKRLRRLCGDRGIACLIRLWLYAAISRRNGDLSGMTDDDIDEAAGWNDTDSPSGGNGGPLTTHLSVVGFIDGEPGARVLHDWIDRQPMMAKNPAKVESGARGGAAKAAKARGKALADGDGTLLDVASLGNSSKPLASLAGPSSLGNSSPSHALPSHALPSHVRTTEDKEQDIVPPEAGGTRPSSSPKDRCPYQQILDLYHEILPELPRVHVWDGPDRRSMSARWKEDKGRQTLDWWRAYFEQVKACPWLMGKVKDFRADLAWLVRPTNMGNVLNGRYAQRPCSPISRANAATLEAFINAGPGGDVGFGGAGGGDE